MNTTGKETDSAGTADDSALPAWEPPELKISTVADATEAGQGPGTDGVTPTAAS